VDDFWEAEEEVDNWDVYPPSDDEFSLQNESPPPPPLSNTALSSSSRVHQPEITDGTVKPSQKQITRGLDKNETQFNKRNDTQSRLHRKPRHTLADAVLLSALAPDRPGLARQNDDLSPTDTHSSAEIPSFTELIDGSFHPMAPANLDFTRLVGSSLDTLDVRRREHYSAETTTTLSISVKSTISEDLSREDKDRGAKLRYLQKRLERQTLGSYKA
jgi:hypothetical protein